MNSLVRSPVEGEALGPAKTEPPVNVIVGGRAAMGVPSVSVLIFASLFPAKGILVPLLEKE